jgi:Na+/H+-dicarboxylate symporter
VAAIFVAQYMNLDLGFADYALIALAAVIGQLGTGGTPGPALVALTLTLTTVGLPLEAVGYLIAIDKVIDMARTALNVAGQLTVPVLVARSEKLLDEDLFNAVPVDLTAGSAAPGDGPGSAPGEGPGDGPDDGPGDGPGTRKEPAPAGA